MTDPVQNPYESPEHGAETRTPPDRKPARYQYIAAIIIGGITAMFGLLALAAFFYFLMLGKPPVWKALGFGIFFLLIALVRIWSILRVPRERK